MSYPFRFAVVAAVSLFLSGFSLGQTATTSLKGVISDPKGAVIAGASVTIADPSKGYARSAVTDEQGFYQFVQIPPGSYSLTVSAAGFAVSKKEGLQLLVNVPASLSVAMHLEGGATTVDVTAAAEQLNTEDATLGTAFNSSQIASLPFEGRDPTQILSLQAGVTYVGSSLNQDQDSRGGSVNGARSDQTNITLDGVDDNDQVKGYAFQGALRSTLDSLQEFRVTTTNANADSGRSSGAQVSLVTKSGTNEFHGSAYEYNRTNLGQANDWFNKRAELQSGLPNKPGQLIRNTFGATLGGPIAKDRLFVFFAYEGQRTSENTQVTRTVPSNDLRQGLISYTCASDPACPQSGVETLTPQQFASTDPNCTANGSCAQGAGADPSILALFQQYPQSNTSSVGDGLNFLGYTFAARTPGVLNTYVAKLDTNITQNQHLFVRGGLVGDRNGEAPEFPGQPSSTTTVNTSKGIIAGYEYALRANLVNNLRYGFIRQGTSTLGQLNSRYIVFGNGPDPLSAQSFTSHNTVPVHNIADDLSWVRGKHTLQFGGNFRLISSNRSSNQNSYPYGRIYTTWLAPFGTIAGTGGSLDPGAFGFPAVDANFGTGYDFPAAALAGLLDSSYSLYNITKQGTAQPEGAPAVRHFRAKEFETFAQDSWHVTPHLVLTYGLRYSLLEPPYETTGTQVSPSISLDSFFTQRARAMQLGQTYNPSVSFDLSGQANGRSPYWNWEYGNVAPRVSFAWSPNFGPGLWQRLLGKPEATSIRGGYGIYYDHFGQGIIDSFDRNGSFGLTTSIQNPVGQFTVDTSPRYTGLSSIPAQLIAAPPTGSFPKTPAAGLPDGATIYWGLDDKLKTPYSHVVDFSVSHEMRGNFVLQVSYIGRFGRRLLQEEDLAMPLDIRDPQSHQDYFSAATLLSKAAAAGVSVQNLQPIPFFENVFSGAAATPFDVADSTGATCAPGISNFAGPHTATQSMYALYSCFLHNETAALFNADIPGEAASVLPSAVPGPGGCFPSCATLGGKVTPQAFFNPQFTSLYAWKNQGNSSYNALQVTLTHKMARGLQADFNYTYSKSLDIGSNAERVNQFDSFYQADQVINSWSPNQLRAVSDFDTAHQFNSNWVYVLPVGRGQRFANSSGRLLDGFIGGWQWSGLARWTSGFPTTVTTFTSYPTNWELPSAAILTGAKPKTGSYTDQNGNPNLYKDPVTAQGAFRYSYPGESGQRNELRGPGYFGIDASIAKTWAITEKQALRLTWEVFNITNSVRFDVAPLPQTTGQLEQPSNAFGVYSSTLTRPRIMEFALRYSF